ncbi:UbiX-like flavin prenyltransferase [Lactobacillus helveticus]|nr:UbiX-like flavin prenyltransferase [Lactobacillus helveticus]NRO09567.1 UbiX-like flavin prenyltransferase [Lactobacillus helveticus]NRO65733.1 UbiX-like flavin prenyltransferase [Lactobacillus helveticus]
MENIKLETPYDPQNIIEMADFYYDNNNLDASISSGSFQLMQWSLHLLA